MPFQNLAPVGLSLLEERRRLRTVRSLQTLAASPRRLLDDIAEVAGRTIRSDIANILLAGQDRLTVIGAYNMDVRQIGFTIRAADWPEDGLIETHHLGTRDWAASHPMVNGTVDCIESALYAGLRQDGQVIGLIGVGSRSAIGAYTKTERDILQRLRLVTEAAIRSEATLARLAGEAFRALERCRAITGART